MCSEYAAAFFLLGGSLKDAVSVCLKQIKDFQLAIAIARVVEQSNEGPVLKEILSKTVIPLAFESGNRYLGSWAFWVLHRRDLAVRILVVSILSLYAPSPRAQTSCRLHCKMLLLPSMSWSSRYKKDHMTIQAWPSCFRRYE
jgi:RAVE protein 1 C terminal.